MPNDKKLSQNTPTIEVLIPSIVAERLNEMDISDDEKIEEMMQMDMQSFPMKMDEKGSKKNTGRPRKYKTENDHITQVNLMQKMRRNFNRFDSIFYEYMQNENYEMKRQFKKHLFELLLP